MGKERNASASTTDRESTKKFEKGEEEAQSFPLRWVVITTALFGLAIRGAVGLHPYSGENTPPMFGDYEAQRHWMEIALHVPMKDWYKDTPDNELSYWGLDYPPLSGYVSWVFGKLVAFVQPEAVYLKSSRGFESSISRALMRLTVLLSDLLVLFPALFFACYTQLSLPPRSIRKGTDGFARGVSRTFAVCSTLPALILIDHGHFQYNGFSLGLFVGSIAFLMREQEAIAASLFCLSLFFKHMGLYYGLGIFSYLLSRMINEFRHHGSTIALRFAAKVFAAIVATTLLCFAPWLSRKDEIAGLFHRLFPVSRGLYEDKVANVWCSLSIVLKLNNYMGKGKLFLFCAIATVLASAPFCIAVIVKPSPARLLLSTSGCALAAYLFSYQVHEKQILIPLLPALLLFQHLPSLAIWMSFAATLSIFPLMVREGLAVAYVACSAIHFAVLWSVCTIEESRHQRLFRVFGVLGTAIGVALNIALVVATPPLGLPDVFVLLNTIYACGHFCLIYAAMLYLIWMESSSGRFKGPFVLDANLKKCSGTS